MRVENPKYLEAVKAGDTVDITYTRALLLEVVPVEVAGSRAIGSHEVRPAAGTDRDT